MSSLARISVPPSYTVSTIVAEFLRDEAPVYHERMRTILEEIFSRSAPVTKWVFDNTEITLFPDAVHNIVALVANHREGGNREIPLNMHGQTFDEYMLEHAESCMEIRREQQPKFFRVQIRGSWPVQNDNSEVRLVSTANNLFWRFFDAPAKTVTQIPFENFRVRRQNIGGGDPFGSQWGLIPYRYHAPFASREERRAFLNDFLSILDGFKMGVCIGPQPNLRQVLLSPIITHSKIDNRYLLSEFMWGVTLICGGFCYGNHAEIVVEKVERGVYSMHKAHFVRSWHTGLPAIINEAIDPVALQYEQRTRVFKADNISVNEMFASIEADRRDPPKLNPFGQDSLLSIMKLDPSKCTSLLDFLDQFNQSPRDVLRNVVQLKGDHSCFTWAREKMKICKINLGESILGPIITRTKNYTSPDDKHRRNNKLDKADMV